MGDLLGTLAAVGIDAKEVVLSLSVVLKLDPLHGWLLT